MIPLQATILVRFFRSSRTIRTIFRKAANLLRDSARAGYVPSMHSLGILLVTHPELEKAPHEGLSLSRRRLQMPGSGGPLSSSEYLLAMEGMALWTGKSALLHFEIAVLQGGEEAEHLLRHDLDKLSADLERGRTHIHQFRSQRMA